MVSAVCDGAGSSSFVYDSQNRLISGGGRVFSWSDRGTMATSLKGSTLTSFGFDVFGQELVAGSVTYSRDSLGRISSRNGQGFAYSGLGPDVCADGTTIVNRDAAGGSPVSVKTGSQASWAVTDTHEDLVALVDRFDGVDGTRAYDPYGTVEGTTGSFVGQVGFQSDWTDPSTGEVDMGARMYMPSVASFTSRDSYAGKLDTPVSLNRYTYGHNNPLRYLDPTGNAVELNPDWDDKKYGLAMEANLLEYKQYEFKRMVTWAKGQGFADNQIQYLLTVHFEKVVNPAVARMRDQAVANWFKAHAKTKRQSAPRAPMPGYDDVVAAGHVSTTTTGTTVPPGTAGSGKGRLVEVHVSSSCKALGSGSDSQVPAFWNAGRGPDPLVHRLCATYLMNLMIQEANGDFGNVDVIRQLARQLFSGTADLSNPYQVFLSNLERSSFLLSRLDRSERSSCQLGRHLMIVCNDTGHLGRGIFSQRGGTTWGNVFLLNNGNVGAVLRNTPLLHHEQVHAQQWAHYGNNYSVLYVAAAADAKGDPCRNQFERLAGFKDGGYPC